MKYNKEQYIKHLQGMIQFETVSNVDPEKLPVEEFLKLHAYLEEAYPLVHKTLEKEVLGKVALVYHWKGTGKSDKLPVLLCAHQDVVPVGDVSAWKYPPFSATIEDGVMYGRGVTDCKNTMMAELEAIEGLIAEGFTPDYDVYLAFGYNEEIMGGPGAACQYIHDAFVERGIQFGLVLDEGGGVMNMNGKQVGMVFISEKGYADHEFTIEDGGGHAAMPPEHNALGKLGKAMYDLEANPMEPKLCDSVIEMFKYQSVFMPEPLSTLMADPVANWEQLKVICAGAKNLNTYIRTTTTPTMAQGSGQANILPAKASIITNSRLLPGDTLDDLMAHFKKVLPEEVHVKLLKGHNPPQPSNSDTPGYRLLKKVTEEMNPGVYVMPAMLFAGTDSRYYCDICNCVCRFSGGKASPRSGGAHAVDERIDTEILESAVEFYVRILEGYADAE